MAVNEPLEAVQPETLLNIIGEIVATNVSLEDYLAHYAEHHCEWVEGVVIRMSPADHQHNELLYYLYQLLRACFELRPISKVIGQPFVMRLPEFPNRRREPDLLAVLHRNPHTLTKTYLDGPADLCIEVVSEGSVSRDRGDKFIEYEKGGVGEYWLVDRLRKECRFYRRNDEGRFVNHDTNEHNDYQTPLLPGLRLHVPTLWQAELPGTIAVGNAVKAMLED